jgi:hypothetical protein
MFPVYNVDNQKTKETKMIKDAMDFIREWEEENGRSMTDDEMEEMDARAQAQAEWAQEE